MIVIEESWSKHSPHSSEYAIAQSMRQHEIYEWIKRIWLCTWYVCQINHYESIRIMRLLASVSIIEHRNTIFGLQFSLDNLHELEIYSFKRKGAFFTHLRASQQITTLILVCFCEYEISLVLSVTQTWKKVLLFFCNEFVIMR